MGKKDPRIDAHIKAAAPFAKPILTHLRKLVHDACPDVEETIKWRFPHFMYKGMLCGMGAFKQHCTFGFWHKAMRKAADGDGRADEAMGQFGRITRLDDLPGDAMIKKLVKTAMKLNDQGIKSPRPESKPKPPVKVPDYFRAALNRSTRALKAFESLSPSHKREYVEWITEAKREETREKRIATALEWLSDGKSRNWKYEKC